VRCGWFCVRLPEYVLSAALRWHLPGAEFPM
jgi:hypothetical protein